MIIAQTGQRIYSMKLEYQLRALHTWREHKHTEELNIKDAHAKPQRLPRVFRCVKQSRTGASGQSWTLFGS